MRTTSSTGGETHILAGAAEVRVTAAVMEEKSGMLELDTIELVMPRLVRLITFYDFAAINRQRMRPAARRSNRCCECRNDHSPRKKRNGYQILHHRLGGALLRFRSEAARQRSGAAAAPATVQRLHDLGELRLKEMDEAGIDLQVLSHTMPGLQKLDAETAAPMTA